MRIAKPKTIFEARSAPRARRMVQALLAAGLTPIGLFGQTALTWEQIKVRFTSTNPTLQAAQLNIDESRAAEITAYLRPNPNFSISTDGTQLARYEGVWRPFIGTQFVPGIDYLHERAGKRELRRDSAKQSTEVAKSSYLDQERGLLFTLQSAFVNVLQAKAFLDNAKLNLTYWDGELKIDKTRLDSGDIAQVDYERLDLQRVQFESDFETATVNLRTAKIQLLMLLNDRTPIERFDVKGPYEFADLTTPLEQFHRIALETRPDLRVATQNIELARINYRLAVANGSTDPSYSVWVSKNPSFNNPYDDVTLGASISIPLRIFDRNQGNKAQAQITISQNERLRDAAEAQVFNDVDSAYVTILSTVNLLKPYKEKYLDEAARIRDRVSIAYRNGGASLLDYLDAEKAFRDTRLAYLNLIGSYLSAAAQMNQAVGREVM